MQQRLVIKKRLECENEVNIIRKQTGISKNYVETSLDENSSSHGLVTL